MPANLTPQYLEAEAKFRQANSPEEKLKALELMMAVVPKHKGTEKLRAQLKSRMAKLRQEMQKRPATGRGESIFNVKREGAGQVVIVGLPNSGKSAILSALTNAESEVADYPFTTRRPVPGMMAFENLQIQLVDTPPLHPDHVEPGFPNIVRNGDALALVSDLSDDPVFQIEVLLEELARMKVKPVGKEPFPELEEGWVARRALVIGNKCDLKNSMEGYKALEEAFGKYFPLLPVSAKGRMNLEELKRTIFQLLDIIRVYTKAPGRAPDTAEPVVLKKGATIGDVALSVHKDFAAKLRFARVWGSGKFGGQMVNRDYVVSDQDIVELHI